jgi:hypothetical protein
MASYRGIAGIRGAWCPRYAAARTVPLLQRFLSAPRTRFPDALAEAPRRPELRLVSEKVVVGTGPNRIEIYPLRGEPANAR